MTETYDLKLGPLTRKLPLIPINDQVTIASFVLLGDAELTHYAAEQLAKRVADVDFDYIVTIESKGIPLAQELSWLTHHDRYIVLRKSEKDYMVDPIDMPVSSITTSADQKLVLDGTDAKLLAGKRVLIVDDVISSGGSIETAHQLLDQVGAKVVKQLAILAEGDAADREDIHFLGKLPLF
ncbi:phosphoribosyltransferase family protein [Secundilactobacillus paracollinoides]|uniref:Adenine phosphoribosyltransferase n=1 Tax=Secundilactobacillus paracollinoides TaxID=240427 RepID=A0A1B2IV25_9LACO|nr:phosphoribosyltransferase family protein [Secundilactobacillus paracollinoides]ANZ60085.1 adenine phosphoribosyltransferase [Secundilactobacillus paracollinoides]ANZ65878.1 adenine phosphoribosyltransferase [Secundilactobacillus paracollinoides]KRL78181.1 purine pyrimidine phosphoribosyltransferase [Secundilactobacillus paracollinoides DSM 15502 = JCM 11969]